MGTDDGAHARMQTHIQISHASYNIYHCEKGMQIKVAMQSQWSYFLHKAIEIKAEKEDNVSQRSTTKEKFWTLELCLCCSLRNFFSCHS
jgi:hypothetical protein